jgi:6,7-dimethyl-8-ribityllumazine synthase
MPSIIEGDLSARDARFAIVVSRFNELVTRSLLDGALDALRRHGADADAVTIAWCPGAFEIPLVARRLAASGRFAQAAMETGVPCIFGVLTTDTLEQAFERAGSKAGNKGAEAAAGAIEMVNLLRKI